MLRHERQTVAMELAAALHHSRDVGPEKDDGPRAQTTASSGGRPRVLKEPEPQGGAVTVGYVAAPGPLLKVLSMAGGDSVDGTALRFLVKKALERQKEEEKEERRKAKEARRLEVTALLAVPLALRTQAQQRRIMELSDEVDAETHPKRRKRKKRRKRRTPRTSSLPSPARRRQRQWSACYAGFTGDDVPRVMFPSGVVRPMMLRILAGMDQKDCCSGIARLVLLVIFHLALFLLYVASFLGDDFRNGFWKNFSCRSSSWLSPYSAQCLVRHGIHAVWYVAPRLERDVQRDVRVHSSSCGAHRDVVHSPFGWLYYRCHYNCRDLVLFVGRLSWLCGSVRVAMSCGGGFCSPDGAFDSVWDGVRPLTGKYFVNYFQYQEDVGVSAC